MNENRESLIPKARKTNVGFAAPAKLTQPKTPSFCKPRISVVRHTGNQPVKPDFPSNRLSLNFGGPKITRPSFGVKPAKPAVGFLKPAKPAGGFLKPVKQSFGFLRPTMSSMAKQQSGSNLGSKLETVKESVGVEKPLIGILKVKEENCEEKEKLFLEEMKSSKESLDEAATTESNESAPSTLSNSFIIFEGLDEESPGRKTVPTEISPIRKNVTLRRQTIVPTPKFPKSRSVEKNTKRKLSFVPVSHRFGFPQERLRCTYSPPPDFDVTINSATMSPTYVPPAVNYDRFSTPIMNLTAALSITDDDGDESVYYTPCAEI